MNIVLLEAHDFLTSERVQLRGRKLQHVRAILQASQGDELRVGVVNGRIGRGRIERMEPDALEMRVQLEAEAPRPLPLRLIQALPRPKVLNRTIAAAASMGIKEIDLVNAWRVEKSYWHSSRLSEENLLRQSLMGLEQAGDTMLPTIRLHRLFAPFVREELARNIAGTVPLLAHPGATAEAPRHVSEAVILAIGPEGGFIDREADTFRDIGFTAVSLGQRILRVETALAVLVGRIF